jgi:hypothetical protein
MTFFVNFVGASGRIESFFEWGGWTIPDVMGLYAYAADPKDSICFVPYIGKALDLEERHKRHERHNEAISWGATRLLFWFAPVGMTEAALLDLEKDLIRGVRPPMNKQHNDSYFKPGFFDTSPSQPPFSLAPSINSLFSAVNGIGIEKTEQAKGSYDELIKLNELMASLGNSYTPTLENPSSLSFLGGLFK